MYSDKRVNCYSIYANPLLNEPQMDTLQAMAVFVRVVESGSFSAVARELNMSQPTVSKHIAALEARLGGLLFTRSTRQLSLTDEGERYLRFSRDILASVDVAEQSFKSGRERIKGPLRIASSVSFGRLHIASRLSGFLLRYPEVTVDLQLSDSNVDLVAQGIDIAIRIGELRDSNLLAREIGITRRQLYAAPDYLQRCGVPTTPGQLVNHNCLVFSLLDHADTWRLQHAGRWSSTPVKGSARSNSSEAIRQMVLDGLGISLSPTWLFKDALAAGRVVRVLPDYTPADLPIHAVMAADRRQSARVKAFSDYLRETFAEQSYAGW